jgi:hypothetical protein
MKNNNELDQIVESFLSPAPVKESMGLKELFALFEEVEKLNEVQFGVDPKVRTRGTEEPYKTEFFTLMQNALGDFLYSVKSGTGAVYSFSSLIDIIERLKKGNLPPNRNSQTIAIITFVESLYEMIYTINPDNPDVAGKMFERFVAFATKGKVSSQLILTEPEFAQKIGASNKSIFDLTTQINEFVSVKLLGSFKVTGSINSLYKFITGTKENFVPIPEKITNEVQTVTYIIAIKEDINTIVFYSFVINAKNFINIIGEETIQRYNEGLEYEKTINDLHSLYKANNKKTLETISKLDKNITQSEKNELLNKKDQLEIEKLDIEKKLGSLTADKKPKITSFSIDINKAEVYKQSVLWEKKLTLTVEEKNTIVENNTLSFKTSIKGLIDEATAVYYKVNNLLLKMEDPNADLIQKTAFGQEAYDSASSLEQGILSLSKEKQLDVKETSKPS